MTIEAGPRRLYTDYFDDVSTTYADPDVLGRKWPGQLLRWPIEVSMVQLDNTNRQRGNASDKDWYMFTGITLNYTLSKTVQRQLLLLRGSSLEQRALLLILLTLHLLFKNEF